MNEIINIAVKIGIVLVALEHLYILYVEMFAWETKGKKIATSMPHDMFTRTKSMAANQGLYNGFLAAGLLWSLFISDAVWQKNIAIFFLSCVVVAGVYGSLTASKSIFFKQGLPALIVLVLLLITQI